MRRMPWPIRRRPRNGSRYGRRSIGRSWTTLPGSMYNDKRFLLKSKRLQGPEAAFVSPTLPLIDYPQVYAADAK